MTAEAPATETTTLLASYPTPSGHIIELRRNEYGYFTVSLWEDGSRLAIAVSRESALDHYQLAKHEQGGAVWSWQ